MAKQKRTKEKIIEIIKEKNNHQYEYDYSLLPDIIGVQDIVKIKCIKHNLIFEQKLANHLAGNECPECAKEKRSRNNPDKIKENFDKCRNIHNNQYEYDESFYDGTDGKIRIKCPKHGWFEQLFKSHYYEQKGCPECAKEKLIENQKLTQEKVINKLKEIFPEYKFDKTIYTGINNRIIITCPKHGDFEQSASGALKVNVVVNIVIIHHHYKKKN